MQNLLKELFDCYYKDIYNYLYSMSRDPGLSEDLTSEVFLEVVKSVVRFRGESDIKTWLFSIARHKWLSHLRQKQRQIQTEMLTEFYPDQSQCVEKQYEVQAMAQRIDQLLEAEPKRKRRVVKMRLEGYSFYEIGVACGISDSSARVIDFRVKAKIRDILRKEGFDDE